MSKCVKRFAQRGFSLIEIMLVIVILAGVALLEMKREAAEGANQAAVSEGRHLLQFAHAVDAYLVSSRSALQKGTDSNCVSVGPNVCELNLAALTGAGALPPGWSNFSAWNSLYVARVRRVPAPAPAQAALVCAQTNPLQDRLPRGCLASATGEWALQALIFTQDPWTEGGAPGAPVRLGPLGGAAREAGPNAGVTNAGEAVGLGAGWRVGAGNEFGPGLTTGQLVYLAGAEVNYWSQFVSLEGARMAGNFDMGGNSVQNMNDMSLIGPETNRRYKKVSSLVPNWVFKGVYQVDEGGYVPAPMCLNGGVAKIKLLLQYLVNDKPLFYNDAGVPPITPASPADFLDANAQLAAGAPTFAWRVWADPSGAGWVAHFQQQYSQRDMTAGSTNGSGLAEVYCHYLDQQP